MRLLRNIPFQLNLNFIKSSLILVVFLLFLTNASGLLSFRFSPDLDFSISSPLMSARAAQESLQTLSNLVLSRDFLIFIVIGLTLSLLLPALSPLPGAILTVLLAVPPFYLAHEGWLNQAILPKEYYLLTIFIIYAVHVLVSYFQETKARQNVINTFSHFVPPEIVREICRSGKQINLDGESRLMTVLFADLVDFTSAAERISPKELTRLLNDYFTAMTRVLHNYGVTIDKYIGDSIMAFCGAPLLQPDHADRSVAAALDMQKELKKLADEFAGHGWPAFNMNIGINTGLMSVGNMGTQYRITYTVIGDAVNISSRLEKLTREYGVPIIVNGTTREATKKIRYRSLDHINIKGKQSKIRIYQPLCLLEETSTDLEAQVKLSDEAVNQYINGNHREALDRFRDLNRQYPQDGFYTAMLNKISLQTTSSNS